MFLLDWEYISDNVAGPDECARVIAADMLNEGYQSSREGRGGGAERVREAMER